MSGFEERLREQLERPLPGPAAQGRFAPELSFGRHFASPPADARQAAVVVLVFRAADDLRPPIGAEGNSLSQWRIPLIVRPTHLEHHGGQIGLPGGLIEPSESTTAAALRELHEELGVPSERVTAIGELSPLFVYVSNHYVRVLVATAREPPTFIVNVDEVAEVIEYPLGYLHDRSQAGIEVRKQRGVPFAAPYFAFNSHRIWGATAMILSEFGAVIE